MTIKITVFDGAGCIGGNKIHLEFEGRGVMFDFGSNYGLSGRYYEEFLNPRGSRGLADQIRLGLLPRIDVYRKDLVPDDLDMSDAEEIPMDALLISHAHLDHIGMAGHLDEEIPFICSPMTAALIKGMAEAGRATGECVTWSETERCNQGRVIEKVRGTSHRRPYWLTTDYSDDLNDLWLGTTRAKEKDGPGLSSLDQAEFNVKAFPVDHSIYGSTAYGVETEEGWVIYSGDLRLHGRNNDHSREFLAKARALHPRALIIEGTRASRETDHNVSEEEVRDKCLGSVDGVEGLIVADFGPRNFERLDMFIDIARKVGRNLVVTMKDAYMLDAVRSADGVDRMKDVLIFGRLQAKVSGMDKQIIDSYSDRIIDPSEIGRGANDHMLCFSFQDMNDLLDVGTKGGRYIFSSSEAYSEESEFSFARLANWLRYFEMDTVGFHMVGERPVFEKGFHASGHLSIEDLHRAVGTIAPDLVIPVHTTQPDLFEEFGVKVVVPQTGRPIILDRDRT